MPSSGVFCGHRCHHIIPTHFICDKKGPYLSKATLESLKAARGPEISAPVNVCAEQPCWCATGVCIWEVLKPDGA